MSRGSFTRGFRTDCYSPVGNRFNKTRLDVKTRGSSAPLVCLQGAQRATATHTEERRVTAHLHVTGGKGGGREGRGGRLWGGGAKSIWAVGDSQHMRGWVRTRGKLNLIGGFVYFLKLIRLYQPVASVVLFIHSDTTTKLKFSL